MEICKEEEKEERKPKVVIPTLTPQEIGEKIRRVRKTFNICDTEKKSFANDFRGNVIPWVEMFVEEFNDLPSGKFCIKEVITRWHPDSQPNVLDERLQIYIRKAVKIESIAGEINEEESKEDTLGEIGAKQLETELTKFLAQRFGLEEKLVYVEISTNAYG